MAYRDEIDALRAREAQLVEELAETRRLRQASEKRALPVLEGLRVASPCPAKWEDMVGDDRVRFCGSCAKNVYDLSAMTRDEAERFVASRTEAVCVTFRRRADGRVLTSDCPVGVRRRRRFGVGVVAFAAVAAAVTMATSRPLVSSGAGEPEACALGAKLERYGAAPKRADARAKSVGSDTPHSTANFETVTGVTAAPKTKEHGPHRLTGCLCQPGDPLCSCL